MCDLYFRTGYDGIRGQVGPTDIERCLVEHPDWIEAWFLFSEDKRSGGWWIGESGGTFAIGYVSDARREGPIRFETKLGACIAFVVRELDDVSRACKSFKSRAAGVVLRALGDR